MLEMLSAETFSLNLMPLVKLLQQFGHSDANVKALKRHLQVAK